MIGTAVPHHRIDHHLCGGVLLGHEAESRKLHSHVVLKLHPEELAVLPWAPPVTQALGAC